VQDPCTTPCIGALMNQAVSSWATILSKRHSMAVQSSNTGAMLKEARESVSSTTTRVQTDGSRYGLPIAHSPSAARKKDRADRSHLVQRMRLAGRNPGRNPGREPAVTITDRTTSTRQPDGKVRQLIEVSIDTGQTWRTTFDAVYEPSSLSGSSGCSSSHEAVAAAPLLLIGINNHRRSPRC
jgi:hypothetical protein